MANKRMLSIKIIDSDAFLDMPQTSQLLYFHLAMRTDDDGFVGNPKKIMRMIGSSENDLTILFTKKFIIGFESGVIVIKHHRINNNWDSYNCKRTQYIEEFNQLNIKENGVYTLDNTQGLLAQTEIRLKSDGKKSLEENRIEEKRIEYNNTDSFSEKIEKDLLPELDQNGELTDFGKFIFVYPLKKSKEEAKKAWLKIKPSKELLEKIIEDIKKRKRQDRQWLEGFIHHPSTYLNQKMWNDEIDTRGKSNSLSNKGPEAEAGKYDKFEA